MCDLCVGPVSARKSYSLIILPRLIPILNGVFQFKEVSV